MSCELLAAGGGELLVDEPAGTRWGAGGTERPPIVTTELPDPVGPPPPSETGSNSEPMDR